MDKGEQKLARNIFDRISPGSGSGDEFWRDVQTLVGSEQSSVDKVVEILRKYFSEDELNEDWLYAQVAESTEVPARQRLNLVSVIRFLIPKALDELKERDRSTKANADKAVEALANGWTESFRSIADESSSDKEADHRKFRSIVLAASELEDDLSKSRSVAGVLPILDSIGHTVELRAVNKQKYKLGVGIDEYAPEYIDFVPMASFILRTDDEEKLYFQVNKSGLKKLIDLLNVAKKDMDAVSDISEEKLNAK